VLNQPLRWYLSLLPVFAQIGSFLGGETGVLSRSLCVFGRSFGVFVLCRYLFRFSRF
jgi:hypothetical protein